MASGPGGCGEEEEKEGVFAYTAEELVVGGVGWSSSAAAGGSRFDRALGRAWAERLARGGLFRYGLAGPGALPTRVLPGPAGLVAQLNPRRASERRAPQAGLRSVRQPFDPAQFNFTQLRPGEVLFGLAGPASSSSSGGGLVVALNASPLEWGHSLLLPEPGRRLPQVLRAEALEGGLEALLLSRRPGFRVGFNSLGASASVNHLHLHALELPRPLPVEAAPARPLLPAAGLHLLPAGPAPALLFYCPADDRPRLAQLARRVCRLTDHLAAREVAHNLLATRGAPPQGLEEEEEGDRGARPGLRVLLWPRRASFGDEEEGDEAAAAFNVAFCELAGFLPLKTPRDFEALTEAQALRLFRRHLLPEPFFAQLLRDLVDLLRE